MVYDEDNDSYTEEVYDKTKLRINGFTKSKELSKEVVFRGVVKFRYNGMDYVMAVELTERTDTENSTPSVDLSFIDEAPDEIDEIWYDMEDDIIEAIKNGN